MQAGLFLNDRMYEHVFAAICQCYLLTDVCYSQWSLTWISLNMKSNVSQSVKRSRDNLDHDNVTKSTSMFTHDMQSVNLYTYITQVYTSPALCSKWSLLFSCQKSVTQLIFVFDYKVESYWFILSICTKMDRLRHSRRTLNKNSDILLNHATTLCVALRSNDRSRVFLQRSCFLTFNSMTFCHPQVT